MSDTRVKALVIESLRIAYVPVAKCANTSGKHLLFEIEHGMSYFKHQAANGVKGHIHDYFRSRYVPLPKGKDWFCFTLVRDPLARLLSAYSNRVLHYRELSAEHLDESTSTGAAQLEPDPDLETFIGHFAAYAKACASIRMHTSPIVRSIGDDIGAYSRVYDLQEVRELERELARRTGRNLKFGRFQSGGPKLTAASLSDRALCRALRICARDYRLLTRYDPTVHLRGRGLLTTFLGHAALAAVD